MDLRWHEHLNFYHWHYQRLIHTVTNELLIVSSFQSMHLHNKENSFLCHRHKLEERKTQFSCRNWLQILPTPSLLLQSTRMEMSKTFLAKERHVRDQTHDFTAFTGPVGCPSTLMHFQIECKWHTICHCWHAEKSNLCVPIVPLGSVRNLQVTNPTVNSLNVRWEPAEGSVRQYRIYYQPVTGGAEEMVRPRAPLNY